VFQLLELPLLADVARGDRMLDRPDLPAAGFFGKFCPRGPKQIAYRTLFAATRASKKTVICRASNHYFSILVGSVKSHPLEEVGGADLWATLTTFAATGAWWADPHGEIVARWYELVPAVYIQARVV